MVIGIAMMAAMAPTVYGISEASNRRSQDKGNEQTATKQEDRYQLLAECRSPSALGIQNAKVFLSMDGKMYMSHHPVRGMVPFNGHFYAHPDFEQGNMVGFVTVSPETPPQLRWAFVDANTHQLAWGGAKEREGHISGPFGLHDDEGSISLNGCQRWIAVSLGSESNEEEGVDSGSPAGPDIWGLYFDAGENQSTDLPAGAERIEVELKMVRYPQRTRRRPANPSMSPVQEAADSNG